MSDGLSGGGGLPVAGWYPDPAGTPQERWWGGLDWTDHLRDTPAVAPVWPPAAAETPTWPGAAVAATAPAWPGSLTGAPAAPATPAYQPMSGWNSGSNPMQATYYSAPTGSPNTVPIWLIATYPLPLLAITLLVGRLPYDQLVTGSGLTSLGFLVLFVLSVVWDFLTLRQRGLPAASPAWMLLGPIGYLIARRIVLGRGGVRHNSPSNAFVIVLIGSVALFMFASFQLGRSPGLAVNELETELEKELLNQSSEVWQVTCPPDAAITVVGTEFTCTATNPAGVSVGISFRVTSEGLVAVGTG